MIRFVFHLCLLAVARAATTSSVEGCDINVRLDITGKNPPVVLIQDDSGQYILAEPNKKTSTASYLSVGNKKILLACPGKRNKLSVGGRSEVEATCTSEGGVNYFVVNGKRIKTDSVSCTSRVQPYELITDRACNDDGKILKLGYMVQGAIKSLINTCHRVADGTTYYSTHVVDGSALPQYSGEKRADDSGRPFFSTHNAALFRGFPAKKYYDQANQLVALSSAIGATAAQATFDARHNKYFAKGHLAPNADFMFSTSRDITFAFVNVQPQWQMINGGHWSHLESAVRKSAASSGRKYFIATGTSGVLSPQGKNVFLDVADQKIPVPETYTKVVRDVKTNQCMAFISNNFLKDSAPEELCENVCSTYKWPKYSSSKEGYIYCCLYDDFKAQFPRNAPTMDCSGGGLSY